MTALRELKHDLIKLRDCTDSEMCDGGMARDLARKWIEILDAEGDGGAAGEGEGVPFCPECGTCRDHLPAQAARVDALVTRNPAPNAAAPSVPSSPTVTLHVGTPTAEPVATEAKCQYCDNTGDVHSIDGEWRGKCTECAAAMEGEFKNFHRQLCERFGYAHDEIDWRRDQISLIEFIAAKPREVPAAMMSTTDPRITGMFGTTPEAGFVHGWNACRASMLAAAPSQGES